MIRWKKGNGVMLFGTAFILLCLSFYAYFANMLLIKQHSYDTQTAADSISDGVASYMSQGDKNFEDAENEAIHLIDLIKEKTGVAINSVEIDEEALEDEKVSVDVSSSHSLVMVSPETENQIYSINAHAATIFSIRSIQNMDSALQWGADSAPYAVYSNSNRTGINEQGYISSTDCSGFVWLIYRRVGCTAPLWYTGDMNSYFYEIAPSEARRGDVLFITASERGDDMGHAKMYLGDGRTLEMGGRRTGIHYGTIDLSNLNGYHFGRIKPQYMG